MENWFGVGFEFLLYDVISTFFEGEAGINEKTLRGYSFIVLWSNYIF